MGPLRSGRDQFLQLLMPWQALYYHDGESACTKFINVYNYSGLNISSKAASTPPPIPMWRTATAAAATWLTARRIYLRCRDPGKLPPTRGSDCNTLMRAPSSALRTTAPAQRTRCPALPPAKTINIVHSDSYKTTFSYNRWDHLYKMSMYSRAAGA